MNRSPTTFEEKTNLSSAWQDVIRDNNISIQFAENLRDSARKNNNIIGMRLDERYHQVVERDTAPKPGYVKLKSVNWATGWLKEVIPADQTFLAKSYDGRVKPGSQSKQTEHPEDYADIIKLVEKKISLQEINEGIQSGEFKIIPDETQKNRLIVQPIAGKNNTPIDSQVVFSIALDDQRQQKMAESGAKLVSKNDFKQPDWWRSEWGDFASAAKHEYPAQYKATPDEKEFKDIKIYGVPFDGKVYPFGKDNDGFLPAVAHDVFEKLPQEAKEIVNTFLPGGQEKMFNGLIKLHEHFWLQKQTDPSIKKIPDEAKLEIFMEVSQYDTSRFGAGRVYDFYVAQQLNRGIEDRKFYNVQHSFENYNPYKDLQADLNSPLLWIDPKGEPTITKTENEHIQFLLQHSDKQIFHLNQNWNMSLDKWGQVALKQMESGIPVSASTVKLFLDANKENLDDRCLIACMKSAQKMFADTSLSSITDQKQLRDQVCGHVADLINKQVDRAVSRDLLGAYSKLKQIDPSSKGVEKVENAYKNFVHRAIEKSHLRPLVEQEAKMTSRLR